MGICRSCSENFAAFCGRSPSVAMRMVWLMLATVTPNCAARSSRGWITISGRCMSPLMRGSRSCGRVRISAYQSSRRRFDQWRIIAGDEEGDVATHAAAPDCFWKWMRASGMRCSCGSDLRFPCLLFQLALFARHEVDISVARRTSPVSSAPTDSTTSFTSGCFLMTSYAAADTAAVCSSRTPGGNSISSCELAEVAFGHERIRHHRQRDDRKGEEERCRRRA